MTLQTEIQLRETLAVLITKHKQGLPGERKGLKKKQVVFFTILQFEKKSFFFFILVPFLLRVIYTNA